MSEFSFPPNTNTHNNNTNSKETNLFSLLLSDLFLFCSFIVSHPLYFTYFIFFSPYIIKILSFLSPLFLTTSLLLLALFTTFFIDDVDASCTEPSEKSKLCFLLSAYRNSVDKLRSHADDANGVAESLNFEDLEAYKIVFDISSSDIEIINREDEVSEENELSTSEAPVDKHVCLESSQLIPEVKSLEGFLMEEKEEEDGDGDGFIDVSCKGSEKKVKPLRGNEMKKVDEQKLELLGRSGSKGTSKIRVEYSQRLGDDDDDDLDSPASYESSLGSFGSMRKDKEWRKTLACKLFEERHNNNNNNVEGSEGMDMLWETYEADSNNKNKKKQQHHDLLAKSKTKKKGKKYSKKYDHNHDDDDEEDEDEEDEGNDDDDGHLCCLQALKFSAGKMNLGMRRPNLVKISKAFKGIGWLHNVTTKHAKKISH